MWQILQIWFLKNQDPKQSASHATHFIKDRAVLEKKISLYKIQNCHDQMPEIPVTRRLKRKDHQSWQLVRLCLKIKK